MFLSRAHLHSSHRHPERRSAEQQGAGGGSGSGEGEGTTGQCRHPAAEAGAASLVPAPDSAQEEAKGTGRAGRFRGTKSAFVRIVFMTAF